MKAIGTGLSRPPQWYDTSPTLGGGTGLLTDPENGANDWRVLQLSPRGAAVAALVVRPSVRHVRLWRVARW